MQINLSATEAMMIFTGQRRAAAFDHLHMAVDLIRAVNIDPRAIDAVKIEDGDPRLFSFSVEASELETALRSAPSWCPARQ